MKTNIVKTTLNLYFKLIGFACIALFCKIPHAQAIEISPLFGIGQEMFSFDVTDIGQKKTDLKLQPNISGVSRLGINAFGFGIGYSFRGTTKDLDPAKGTTDFFDLQLGYQVKNWGIDLFAQTYKGFYTESTQSLQFYPDLQFQHFGIMGRYALSDSDFSISGLLDQSDEVKNTAGKYYLVGGIRHYKMKNTISLMLQDYSGINPELEDLRELKSHLGFLGVGAGKYWVSSNKFFIGGLLDLLGTYGIYSYQNTASETTSSYATLSYNLKLALGYSGEKFKSGLGLSADVTTLKTPGSSLLRPSAQRILLYIRTVF